MIDGKDDTKGPEVDISQDDIKCDFTREKQQTKSTQALETPQHLRV